MRMCDGVGTPLAGGAVPAGSVGLITVKVGSFRGTVAQAADVPMRPTCTLEHFMKDTTGDATAEGADLPGSLKFAEDLHFGDLMVHEDHGLGRFEGMEHAAGEDVIRMAFEGDASLLVPVSEAGKLWRHGDGESSVPLDRLGGTEWKRRSAALRRRTTRAAGRLVRAARAREEADMPILTADGPIARTVAAGFRWTETPDQQAAIDAVLTDLASDRGMDRLLVGDVGFGKTEVAIRAMAAAAGSGLQVALLAPTTVLVRQHAKTLSRRFAQTGITVASLSRHSTAAEARATRAGLRDGSIEVVVGTHALLSKATTFADLGLIVIDEEQRFGKAHKRRLRRMAEGTHVLSMTATPIPGSLQKALVGIQDLSVLSTPPGARQPVETRRAPLTDDTLRDALMAERGRGGQSFVVVPRIADIEVARNRIVEVCPDLTLKVAHGDLPPRDLDAQMTGFAEGDGDVLLATTLIEMGLDVPRANSMVVLRPDLFGLTQLHQLRGRIGRRDKRGTCLLLTESPPSAGAARRLDTLVRHSNLGAGFRLSRLDLDRRGGGDPSAADQTGHAARIGPALHADLMARALRRARGLPARRRPAVAIEGEARLPHSYVPDPETRATLYNRIGHVVGPQDARDLRAEMEARFGPMPAATRALLDIADLSARAADRGIVGLSAGSDGVAIDLALDAVVDTLPDGAHRQGDRLLLSASDATFAERIAALSTLIATVRLEG